MSRSVVEVADEVVSIVTALRMFGVELDEHSLRRKLRCPFGIYHSDHGLAPAMRVYLETNSAYCFSCTLYLTPVSLAAKAMDCDRRTAAERLLDRIGHRPMDLAGAWRHAVEYTPEPNTALMAEALKTYCRRISPSWAQHQFDPQVAAALTWCLSLLDLVVTEQDVTLWLTSCKAAMKQVLEQSTVGSVSLNAQESVQGSQ